eukprot:CAMPEP_0184284406 /NCGR_PEP_ID=MMETSP0977-20130417/66161_1 /TAXON_ID=483370 /ORGANISM="non described non described, Strain CCMP2097" /LENGTH=51 /DNA_ID=CAMNT_0026590417 /DNA_START=395 /DNA_END=554 /DNA_ORIENTATION=+
MTSDEVPVTGSRGKGGNVAVTTSQGPFDMVPVTGARDGPCGEVRRSLRQEP